MKCQALLIAALTLVTACSTPAPRPVTTRAIRIEAGSLAEVSVTKGSDVVQPVGMTPVTIQYPVENIDNENFGIVVKFMSDGTKLDLYPYIFGRMVQNKDSVFIPAPEFGEIPDRNTAIEEIKANLETRLVDSSSAIYKWGQFSKEVFGVSYCWHLEFMVNAKNSFGGYVGWRTAYATFDHGSLVNVGIDNPR